MKYQKEIKAGLIAVIAIASFVCLVNFLKGSNLFQQGILLHAVYDDIIGLEVSRPVIINGLKVGKVEKIYFHPDHSGRLIVEMRIATDFDFSVNTVAMINESGLVSGPEVRLILSHEGCKAKDGDTIKGLVKSSALSGLLGEVAPIKIKLQQVLTCMDSALLSLNSLLDQENKTQIKHLFKGLNTTLQSMKTSADSITQTTHHFSRTADSATMMIINGGSGFNTSLQHIGAAADVYKKLADRIDKINIENTFIKLDTSLQNLDQVMSGVNKGEGTLGKFTTDDKLYNHLNQLSGELGLLAKDLRLHPKRYFHFSLFGKREQSYQKEPPEKNE
ncbi:MAG: MlaD family protein [Flavobacteriales bacterium AspAUS03]